MLFRRCLRLHSTLSQSNNNKHAAAVDEYLYGTQSVLMALQSQERRLKKLLVKGGERVQELESNHTTLAKSLASKRGIPVSVVPASLLEKHTGKGGGTNNGLCLLASKLDPTPLFGLRDSINGSIRDFELETIAGIWTHRRSNQAHPLLLVLDKVADPQNLGAIIRTASFLGIDGLVLTERETCPLSAHVSKASAGALETFIPSIYSIKSLRSFTRKAKGEGFRILTTPLSSKVSEKTLIINSETAFVPLLTGPTLLIMGNESKGLRADQVAEADFELKIEGYGQSTPSSNLSYTVDSLNLSVATAILLARLLSY